MHDPCRRQARFTKRRIAQLRSKGRLRRGVHPGFHHCAVSTNLTAAPANPRTGGLTMFFLDAHCRQTQKRVWLLALSLSFLAPAAPAQNPWFVKADLSSAELGPEFNAQNSLGYRLVEVSAFEIAGAPRFVGLWEKRARPGYAYYFGMSSAGLDIRQGELTALGYRMVLMDRYADAGAPRYTALWENWIGGDATFDRELFWTNFPGLIQARQMQGFRPVRLDVHPDSTGTLRVAGVWEARADPPWKLLLDVPESDFAATVAAEAELGFVPWRVAGYENAGQGRLVLHFEAKPQRTAMVRAGMTSAEFQTELAAQEALGRRPLSVSGYARSNEATYAAIWVQHTRPPLPLSYAISGAPVPQLATLDTAVMNFMRPRGISAGALTVARNGVVVLERGYGWQDFSLQQPVRRTALFRVASLSKPVTTAAIKRLSALGTLSLSARVFDLGQPGGGLLPIDPFGTPDPRLQDVTVQHLLDHKGGWDRDISGDPMFRSASIANPLAVPMPPMREDIVRWVAGQALDHDPGSTYAYSNFGYMLLGLVIERVTGQDAMQWIHANILAPQGVAPTEAIAGRTLPEHRDPREVHYFDPDFSAYNVYRPAQFADSPDGEWNHEAHSTDGGWVFTTRAYVRFLLGYWINGDPRTTGSRSYIFSGSLDGTRTYARQRSDGVSYAVFFNQNEDASGLSYDTIDDELDAAIASISSWPATDPHANPPTAPQIRLEDGAVRWKGIPGQRYQVFHSANLADWRAIGSVVASFADEPMVHPVGNYLSGDERGYFRVVAE